MDEVYVHTQLRCLRRCCFVKRWTALVFIHFQSNVSEGLVFGVELSIVDNDKPRKTLARILPQETPSCRLTNLLKGTSKHSVPKYRQLQYKRNFGPS
jgi:hypothetical protein